MSSRRRRHALGAGGAHDRADQGQPARRPGASAPAASTSSAIRSCSGAPPASRSWRSAAPGLEVLTSRKQPAPAARGRGQQRLERVAPQQGVGRERVGAEARDLPERPRRGAHQRLPVGGGGHRHVAALAVGDDQQPVLARGVARTAPAHPTPARPRRSKQASWSLTATHAGPAASIAAAQWRTTASAVATLRLARHPLERRRPQRRRVGVEPEHDPAAALLYERREPVREVRLGTAGSGAMSLGRLWWRRPGPPSRP